MAPPVRPWADPIAGRLAGGGDYPEEGVPELAVVGKGAPVSLSLFLRGGRARLRSFACNSVHAVQPVGFMECVGCPFVEKIMFLLGRRADVV